MVPIIAQVFVVVKVHKEARLKFALGVESGSIDLTPCASFSSQMQTPVMALEFVDRKDL